MKKWVKPSIWFGATIALVILADMLSKILTDTGGNERLVRVIPKFFNFASTYNYGVAFSFLSGAGVWLILFTSVLIVGASAAWWFLVFHKKGQAVGSRAPILRDIALGLFIGGALGNWIDRVFLGYVRDFIKLDFMRFPIFNFADMCLNIGMVLIVIWLIFFTGKKKEKKLVEVPEYNNENNS